MDQNAMMGGMPMLQGGMSPQDGQGDMNGMNGMPMPQSMNGMGAMNAAPLMGGGPMGGNPMMPGVVPGVAPIAAPAPAPTAKKNGGAEIAILVVVCLIAAIGIVCSVYFFMQWNTLKQNFDNEVSTQRAAAQSEQIEKDAANYAEKAKNPYAPFSGPSDYGSVYFEYPKTWNSYIDSDGLNGKDFRAYFFTSTVPSVEDKASRYALRFTILNKSADSVMQTYNAKLKNGLVTMQPYSANDGKISGSLFQGTIDKEINGMVFIAKINDKTLIMQTDSTEFYSKDFLDILAKLRRE